MGNYDEMAIAVEMLSGGKNKVLIDDIGLPGIYVIIPKGFNNAVISGGSNVVHRAFKVDNVEKEKIYISKYINYSFNNRGYSLPGRKPKVYIDQPTAKLHCTNKGRGFHLVTIPEWAYVALWSRKNGTMPHGNNNYGADASYSYERGVGLEKDGSNRTTYTATGSGPETWSHDHTNAGIMDLNGLVWEWCDGLRINNGEIQIVENNNAAMGADCDTGANSTLWKAILEDGTLVAPGTSDTLKYDSTYKIVKTLTAATGSPNGEFKSMGLASGLTVPEILKELILYPDEPNGDYGGDYRYWNVEGERLPLCGGGWGGGAKAGVFSVGLGSPRSDSSGGLGFRSAFVDL